MEAGVAENLPRPQQLAWKIAEVARARLLECVDVGDAEALAEAQRMLDALRKATNLAADAEVDSPHVAGLPRLGQAEGEVAKGFGVHA